MLVCQDCGTALDLPPADGKCPNCGTLVKPGEQTISEDAIDGTIAIDATIDEANIGKATIDNRTDVNKTVGEKTVDGGQIDATLDSSVLDEPTDAKPIDATIDANDIEKTVQMDSSSPNKTTPAGIDATLDAGSQTAVDHGAVDRTAVDQTIDGSVDSSVGGQTAQSNLRVTRGRRSMSQGVDKDSLTKWTVAAGSSENPLLSLAGSQSFEYDDVPLNNRRRLAVDPKDNLADYEIVRAVGKGAMGEVFAAKQKSLNRTVALKTISAARSNNVKDQRKFLYEARITSELTHPNIVPVHDLAVGDDGAPFYAMKLVSGTPWQKVIRENVLEENLDIFMKVCDAMGFAHSQNIIHRDLKPENIMLGDFGEVLVMDWGLAVDLKKNQKFDLAGTPAYMSPEMARHEVELIGPTSDIYLLGAILYEIVTGKAPHPGRSVTECVIAASANELIPAPDPDHPLLKIAMVAIATVPGDRYPTVAELQEAIQDYRRHAESLSQTQRAESTLRRAIDTQDYESFSRAIFGFASAIELWDENAKAIEGAKRARLAYGSCAIEQNDFDLALQVLDPDVAEEKVLYDAALAGKQQAQQRIVRIRKLTNTLSIGGGIAAVVFLGLSLWAMSEKRKATESARQQIVLRGIAQAKTEEAEANEAAAKENETRALESEAKARDALEGERKARSELASTNAELQQTNVELDESAKALATSLDKQLVLTRTAEQAAEAERIAREQAVDAQRIAEQEQRRAVRARLVAEIRNYPANLSLAATQIEQRDVGRTLDILQEIDRVQANFANIQDAPTTNNWALERIRLSTNQDIPSYQFAGANSRVASAGFCSAVDELALGGDGGSVEIVRWDGNALDPIKVLDADRCGGNSPVRNIAFARSGGWVAFSKREAEADVMYVWNFDNETVEPVRLPGLRLANLRTSIDGRWLVGMLEDSGVRTWEINDERIRNLEPSAPRNLGQYKILDIVWSDNVTGNAGVGLIEAGGNRYLAKLNLEGDGDLIVLGDNQLRGESFCEVEMLDAEQVLVGERAGKLQIISLQRRSLEIVSELRDDVHQTQITRLSRSPSKDQILSVGLEPVIQIWTNDRSSSTAAYVPTLELLGHESESILLAEFFSTGKEVVSVDAGGRVFLWDLERQAERKMIPRNRLPAPVVYGGGVGPKSTMRSVDANGVIESWNGFDGKQLGGAASFSYVGHTPGAVLQDFSNSDDGSIVVTSAFIGSEANAYSAAPAPSKRREFCVWDTRARTMIRRWSDNRSGFPCVDVSPDGNFVAIGSNGTPLETLVVDLSTGEQTVLLDEKGRGVRADDLAFRKGGPLRLTTAAYSGMVAEFDGEDNFKIIKYNREYLDPPTETSQIVAADWSGNQFAVVFNSGLVRVFNDDSKGNLASSSNINLKQQRFSRGEVDWIVRDQGDVWQMSILASAGKGGQLITLESSASGTAWTEKNRRPLKGQWFLGSGEDGLVPGVSVERQIGVNDLLGFAELGGQPKRVAVSRSGTVALWEPAAGDKVSETRSRLVLGRATCNAVGANAEASRLVLACEDGQLWFASFADAKDVTWTAIIHPFSQVQQVEVSPDGSWLAVAGEMWGGGKKVWCRRLLADEEETDAGWFVENGVSVAWKPVASGANDLGVLCQTSSETKLEIFQVGESMEKPTARQIELKMRSGSRASGIRYFAERFADSDRPTRWHFAVLAERVGERGSEIRLVSETGEGNTGPEVLLPSANVTQMAGSAENNLLAIADADGAVSVWFFAPSVDQQAFELLTIDRHRGQSITQLAFSADGQSLISGDAGGRQFVWLASDPSGGSDQP